MITVCATVLALIALAIHGGLLLRPRCSAQSSAVRRIGSGLSIAIFSARILIPVIYSIFLLDLKLVRDSAFVAASRFTSLDN